MHIHTYIGQKHKHHMERAVLCIYWGVHRPIRELHYGIVSTATSMAQPSGADGTISSAINP